VRWSRNHLSSDENYFTPRDSLYLPQPSHKDVSQQMSDRIDPHKRKSYADRPVTPVGTSTGFTETQTNGNHELTHPKEDRYRYQPAYLWSHPAAYLCETSNYLKACATRIPRSGRNTPNGDKPTQTATKQNDGAGIERVVKA